MRNHSTALMTKETNTMTHLTKILPESISN